MNTRELIPALKPGLLLAILNLVLCALFAVGGAVAIGLSAALLRYGNLPLPLLPAVVAGALPVTVIAWLVFVARLPRARPLRIGIAVIGTLPLAFIAALSLMAAAWFVCLPSAPATAVVVPVLIGLTAAVATAVCAACVLRFRGSPVATPD